MSESVKSYADTTEERIRQAADRQFAKLATDPKRAEQAQSDRVRLYSWLLRVDDLARNPKTLVTDELASDMDVAFRKFLHEQTAPEFVALKNAWEALTPEQALDAAQAVARSAFGHARTGQLLTRRSDSNVWEGTGFHVSERTLGVHVKVGNNPYQPIGYDDGKHFLPTEGSKLLWLRDWAYAVVYPFSPAFEVEASAAKPQEFSDSTALSDKERQRMEGWVELLREDLSKWKALDRKNTAAVEEAESNIRDSVKLLRIQIPRVDQVMLKMETERPEVGEFFANVPADQLLVCTCEYMQMKLDDDTVRRLMDGTTIRSGQALPERVLLEQAKARLAQVRPGPNKPEDGEAIIQCLCELSSAFPALREAVCAFEKANPDATTAQSLEQADKWLSAALAT